MTSLPNLRPSVVGKLNERQVLRAVQAHGLISRAELARQSGLSAPTVSKAVANLLAAGFLEEVPPEAPARGRPAPGLRLATQLAQVVGVVIDAGQSAVASAALDGTLRPGRTVATPRDYDTLIESLVHACRGEMARPGVTTLGVGISLPGLLDDRRGAGILSPNVPVTDGHTPAADLAERLQIPCVLMQETHALCLAEEHFGGAKGLTNFAVVDISTGIGVGVMSGGQLLKGHTGLAGELGHVPVVHSGGRACGCGRVGCLETEASEGAVRAKLAARLGSAVTDEEMVRLAGRGLTPEFTDAAHYLGVGLATVINLFNPANVFLHGRLIEGNSAFFDRVRSETEARSLTPSFAACTISRAAGTKLQGAVAGVLRHLTNLVVPGYEPS